MRIEYCGPYHAVEVPSLGVTCKRGETIDVPDKTAQLMIKQDVWKSAAPVAAPAEKKEAK